MTTPLLQARYLNLATFRKSGKVVETPIWFAPDGDWLYAFSSGEAGKVKRLRNSPRARIAPCTVTGGLLGAWTDTEAFVLQDAAAIQRARDALKRRYGWQMLLLDAGARLGGRIHRRAWLAIRNPLPH